MQERSDQLVVARSPMWPPVVALSAFVLIRRLVVISLLLVIADARRPRRTRRRDVGASRRPQRR